MDEYLPFFVYGTLMPGHPNFEPFLGQFGATTEQAKLYDHVLLRPQARAKFPYLVGTQDIPADVFQHSGLKGDPVRGYVIVVPKKHFDEVLDGLDILEGVPSHYQRVKVEVQTTTQRVTAWTYRLPKQYVDEFFFDPIIYSNAWDKEVHSLKLYKVK